MNQPKLPYNHDYKLHLDIGYHGWERSETVNPSKDSSHSEAKWNALSREAQEVWLYGELHEWAQQYINTYWEVPPTSPES